MNLTVPCPVYPVKLCTIERALSLYPPPTPNVCCSGPDTHKSDTISRHTPTFWANTGPKVRTAENLTCDTYGVTIDFTHRTRIGLFIVAFALISWLAAITLGVEGYYLIKDGTQPSCNINPFFSCGNVMQSDEARAFWGIPNQFFGMTGYAIVGTVGAAVLAGATFARWFWRAFIIGLFAAWGFLMWLFTEAVFEIGFLCLYCMVVWITTTIMVWVLLPWLLKHGLLFDSDRARRIGGAVLPFSWAFVVVNLAVIALSIIAQFPLLLPLLLNG
ncbi:putative membrane protein [Microbacteriaceae bacterium MWH-Ta3]|nr:putative membrane protein [Microbacteriaceae bacterium MWH-Ta3]